MHVWPCGQCIDTIPYGMGLETPTHSMFGRYFSQNLTNTTELCHGSCGQPKLYTKPDSRTCTTVLCTLSEQKRLAVLVVGCKKIAKTTAIFCDLLGGLPTFLVQIEYIHKTVVQVLLSGLVYSLGCLQLL